MRAPEFLLSFLFYKYIMQPFSAFSTILKIEGLQYMNYSIKFSNTVKQIEIIIIFNRMIVVIKISFCKADA